MSDVLAFIHLFIIRAWCTVRWRYLWFIHLWTGQCRAIRFSTRYMCVVFILWNRVGDTTSWQIDWVSLCILQLQWADDLWVESPAYSHHITSQHITTHTRVWHMLNPADTAIHARLDPTTCLSAGHTHTHSLMLQGYMVSIVHRRVLGSKWATISSAMLFICALPFIGMNPHGNFSYDDAQTRSLLSVTMFWFGFTLGELTACNSSTCANKLSG